MKAFFAAASVAAMIALALPATAADSAPCQASWSKMDAQKTGFIMGADAQKHMDMMKKAGRTSSAADRISDKEFMDACIADVFEAGKK